MAIIKDDVRPMLHEFLAALGFDAMARDVQTETEWPRLRHYARVIIKQLPESKKQDIYSRFARLGLV